MSKFLSNLLLCIVVSCGKSWCSSGDDSVVDLEGGEGGSHVVLAVNGEGSGDLEDQDDLLGRGGLPIANVPAHLAGRDAAWFSEELSILSACINLMIGQLRAFGQLGDMSTDTALLDRDAAIAKYNQLKPMLEQLGFAPNLKAINREARIPGPEDDRNAWGEKTYYRLGAVTKGIEYLFDAAIAGIGIYQVSQGDALSGVAWFGTVTLVCAIGNGVATTMTSKFNTSRERQVAGLQGAYDVYNARITQRTLEDFYRDTTIVH